MNNTIRNEREKQGLSQRELANISNVPRSTIFGLENGVNTKFESLVKVVKALSKNR